MGRFVGFRCASIVGLYCMIGCAMVQRPEPVTRQADASNSYTEPAHEIFARMNELAEQGDIVGAMKLARRVKTNRTEERSSAVGGSVADASISKTKTPSASKSSQFAWLKRFRSDNKNTKWSDEVDETNPFKSVSSGGNATADTTQEAKNRFLKHDSERLVSHDAALFKLIDDELKEATPEERYNVFLELKDVDPASVPRILRIGRQAWKMGYRASNEPKIKQASAKGSGNSSSKDGLDRRLQNDPSASGFGYSGIQAPNPRRPVHLNDLGTASPWDKSNPGSNDERTQKTSIDSQTHANRQGFNAHTAPLIQPSVGSSDLKTGIKHVGGQNPVQLGGIEKSHWPTDVHLPNGIRSPVSAQDHNRPSLEGRLGQNRVKPVTDSRVALHGQETAGFLKTKHSIVSAPGDNSFSAMANPEFGKPQRLAQESEDSTSTNATSTDSARDWTNNLQNLIDVVAREVTQLTSPVSGSEAERQKYIAKHVYLRMLYFISGQQGRALEPIPILEPADQEFWQQMFWAIANYFDSQGMPDSSDRASQTIAQLKSAVVRLKEKARLQLGNLVFCQKISSYGNYERFKRDEFSPGQPVLLYAEVENFKSEQTSDGRYRTILKSTIEILKAGPKGDLVKRISFPATEDLCRNQRRDYFHSYEFTIPQRISLGPHVLKLTVEDQLRRKVATYSLNFTVE